MKRQLATFPIADSGPVADSEIAVAGPPEGPLWRRAPSLLTVARVTFGCGRGRVPYLLDREQDVRAAVEHSRFLSQLFLPVQQPRPQLRIGGQPLQRRRIAQRDGVRGRCGQQAARLSGDHLSDFPPPEDAADVPAAWVGRRSPVCTTASIASAP